jgi:hypothetical protein
MSFYNRRNALLGFMAWKLTKAALRSKTPSMSVPRPWRSSGNGRGRWLVAGAAGLTLGALVGGLIWARRRSDGDRPAVDAVELDLTGAPSPDVPLVDEPSEEPAEAPSE